MNILVKWLDMKLNSMARKHLKMHKGKKTAKKSHYLKQMIEYLD